VQRTPRALAISLTAGLAIALAACSGSGSSGSTGGSTRGSGSAGSGEPAATSTVDLPPSYRFQPASIAVGAGTTVTWTNHDNFTHSVQFLDGGLPSDPMLMKPGETATFTFGTAGTYRYQCSLHPQNMQGTVTVTP
jgi:plastocyanin